MKQDISNQVFLSILIPSYNRPAELSRVLHSIDINKDYSIEIVVCEDNAPKRAEVRVIVEEYAKTSSYTVVYVENEENYGFDKNLRQCILNAHGEWCMYMGDDDLFVSDTMNQYIEYLKSHDDLGYVLRSYKANHADGSIEEYHYYSENREFMAGLETYVELFRKSVFISGFCFKREWSLDCFTDELDGVLLYQLYILAEICLKHPAGYYNIPIVQSIDGGTPYFGSSDAEKDLYTPGTITIDNSINFLKGWLKTTRYIDKRHGLESTKMVVMDLSKYSYPILWYQRKAGRKHFNEYHRRLCEEIGLNCSIYYYIYYIGLWIFGTTFCDKLIRLLKKMMGTTPRL